MSSYDWRKKAAASLWRYIDDHGNVFYMGERITGTLKSPISGKSFTSKPTKITSAQLIESLKGETNEEFLDSESGKDQIWDTLQRLSRPRERLSISALREALPGITLSDLHQALLALQDQGKIVLYRNDNPRSLTPADQASVLMVGGYPRHIIYRL